MGALVRAVLRLCGLILIFTSAPLVFYMIVSALGGVIDIWIIYSSHGSPNVPTLKDLFTWMVTTEDIQWRRDALIHVVKNQEGHLLKCAEPLKSHTTTQTLDSVVKSTGNDSTARLVIKYTF